MVHDVTLLQQSSTPGRPSPRPGFISRAYRDLAAASGAVFTMLFVVLAIWLLLMAPTSTGGFGAGEGGGRGGGAGGGIGDGRGPGTGVGLGAADGAGGDGPGGQDGSGGLDGGATHADAAPTDATSEADDRAANRAADDASAESAPRRPPLRVGFTATQEERAAPEAVETPTPVEPANRAGSGGSAGGGGGGDDAPSFMGVRGRGNRVVYVIDRSGSMSMNQRFAHARYELKRSIRALPEQGEFFVIYFDTTALPMPGERLVRSSRSNVDRYSKWIDQQQPGGGTDPTEAMAQALALAPDTIFLLSDGIFAESIAGRIRAANTRQCSICTIAFHDATGEAILQRIARENEGTYRFVPPP